MNRIQFLEFVNKVILTIPEENKDDILKLAEQQVKDVYDEKQKKTNIFEEKKRKELLQKIEESFEAHFANDELLYEPNDREFLTFSSCVDVIKKLQKQEDNLQNKGIRNTIFLGSAFLNIQKLKKVKISKMSIFLKDTCSCIFSQSYVYFCKKMYKLYLRVPIIKECSLSPFFIKQHFALFEDYLDGMFLHQRSSGLSQEIESVSI